MNSQVTRPPESAGASGDSSKAGKDGKGTLGGLSALTGAELLEVLNAASHLSHSKRLTYYRDVLAQLAPSSIQGKQSAEVTAKLTQWKQVTGSSLFSVQAQAGSANLKNSRLNDIAAQLNDLRQQLSAESRSSSPEDTGPVQSDSKPIQEQMKALEDEAILIEKVVTDLKSYCAAHEGLFSFLKRGDLKLSQDSNKLLSQGLLPFKVDEAHFKIVQGLVKENPPPKPVVRDGLVDKEATKDALKRWEAQVAPKFQEHLEETGLFNSLTGTGGGPEAAGGAVTGSAPLDTDQKRVLASELFKWHHAHLQFYKNFVGR